MPPAGGALWNNLQKWDERLEDIQRLGQIISKSWYVKSVTEVWFIFLETFVLKCKRILVQISLVPCLAQLSLNNFIDFKESWLPIENLIEPFTLEAHLVLLLAQEWKISVKKMAFLKAFHQCDILLKVKRLHCIPRPSLKYNVAAKTFEQLEAKQYVFHSVSVKWNEASNNLL